MRHVVPIVLLFASGCPLFFDLDGVTVSDGADVSDDARSDAGASGDDGASNSTTPDVSPPDLNPVDLPEPDLGPSGMVCPGAAPLGGTCNLVAQDCAPGSLCEVGLLMPGVETGCRTFAAGVTYTLALGAPCSPAGANRCAPGLLCRENVCERYCYTEDGLGCQPTEFCASVDSASLPGVGWCSTSCG